MKTLERFWHWVDNENPGAAEVPARARKNLSKVALEALVSAASLVTARALPMCDWDADGPLRYALDRHRGLLRDVSLKLCEALELLHGAIAELPVQTFATLEVNSDALGEWLPPRQLTREALFRPRGFREPAPIFLHPDHYAELQQMLGEPAAENRIECFHCDQSFPESQIDAHGRECRQRTLERFQQMVMAPSPMLTPVPREQLSGESVRAQLQAMAQENQGPCGRFADALLRERW